MSLTPEELTVLTEIPVPQADNLDIVFHVVELVNDGVDTRSAIARSIGYVDRQGPYYADAAMALRLVEVVGSLGRGGQHLRPTPLGMEYLNASGRDRARMRQETVRACPVVKYVSSELGISRNGESTPYPIAGAILDETAVASVLEHLNLARHTAERRAHTLCGWLEGI